MPEYLAHHYLDHSAKLFPKKIAVTDGHACLTFGDLDILSDQLGRFLTGMGISQGKRVVYFLKRDLDCIVATVGILKSGAAYIPVDQKTPLERWKQIIEDAIPEAIICNAATLEEALKRISLLDIQPALISLAPRGELVTSREKVFYLEEITTAPPAPSPNLSLDDVAYVLYTSGSTGVPKGVMITHANIRNYIDWAINYFNITAKDRILGTAPFYFDMSTFDIFCSLATGATLCLAAEGLLLFPEKLVQFIEQERVTIWKGVSSLLMYMCRAGVLHPDRIPDMRTVIFAGEALDSQYLVKWMNTFPGIDFYNGYGPTEATGVSLCYHVDSIPKPGQPIPIGRPCKGAKVVLIEENGLPVGSGEIGELCISGACLSKGYLNDIEKTQRNFTSPPTGCLDLGDRIYRTGDLVRMNSDGNYIFISRKDHQVKWMGYRIELAEIETNLMAHPDIRDAVVLLMDMKGAGLTELAALFEAEAKIDSGTLSQFLEDKIPTYMIPKRFIQVDSLPRNDRGKIARDVILKQYSKPEGRFDVKVE